MNYTIAARSRLVLSLAAMCLYVLLSSAISAEAAVTATPQFTPGSRAIAGLTCVTITCPTPDATIRYTLDSSLPSETNGTPVASGSRVYITPPTVLRAKAWAPGFTVSNVRSGSYTAPSVPVVKPYYIVHGTSTVDGDLSDWADAEWTALDQPYDVPLYPPGAPLNPRTPDIAEVYYAIRWTTDKVYVAIKVRDTVHYLLDGRVAWDSCDLAEYCIHTTGTGATDYNNHGFVSAQEYVVGIRRDGNSVWTSLGPTGTAAGTGIIAAGKVEGQWLNYEVALIPYQILNTANPSQSVISYLSAGDVFGFDPQVVANDGATRVNSYNSLGYTGTVTENMMTGKFMNYTRIGRHMLVPGGSVSGVKGCVDGTVVGCSGVVTAVFADAFYVEASDRTSGIRVVKSAHGVSVGYLAKVLGIVTTDAATGERYIDAAPGTVSGAYRGTLAPLGMTNKSLGPNNIGMYVRTTGRVADKGDGWFTIDDGSGVAVKVVGSAPSGTPYVVVTGANSCEKDIDEAIQRRIIATSIVEAAP